MISWIRGEIIDTWLQNKKFYALINCNGLGYEIQILDSLKKHLDTEIITLWIQQIKREDTDLFFGFKEKSQRDFFRNLLNIKGIGPQIGMALLNKHDFHEIIDSVKNQDKKLFNLVPGIGPKMTERILFELKNKILTSSEINKIFDKDINLSDLNKDIKILLDDVDLALKTLSYTKKERIGTRNFISENLKKQNLLDEASLEILTFENLLKDSLAYLEQKQ